MATKSQIEQAVKIVRGTIQALQPEQWHKGKDWAGHEVHVHRYPGGYRPLESSSTYAATVVYETYGWVDYDLLDRISEEFAKLDIPLSCEYLSSYEVGLEELS